MWKVLQLKYFIHSVSVAPSLGVDSKKGKQGKKITKNKNEINTQEKENNIKLGKYRTFIALDFWVWNRKKRMISWDLERRSVFAGVIKDIFF